MKLFYSVPTSQINHGAGAHTYMHTHARHMTVDTADSQWQDTDVVDLHDMLTDVTSTNY